MQRLHQHTGEDYVEETNDDGSVSYICQYCGQVMYVINNSALNGEYYMGTDLVVFNNGVLTAMGSEFTYTYNVTTGRIDTSNPAIYFNVVDGVIYFKDTMQRLHQHTGEGYIAEEQADGSVNYICQFCGQVMYVEAPEHTHTEVEIPAIRPTPSTVGYTAGIVCSECGETIKAPVAIEVQATTDSTFRINNATLGISENINMIYRVTLPAGYEDAYLVFTFNGKEYVVDVSADSEHLVPGYTNRYNCAFSGVTPQFMGRNVTANLYAKVGDSYIAGAKVIDYSVRKYCETQLSNAGVSATIKTLISDFLVYGAKAQIVMNEDVDNLVTADLNITPSEFQALSKEDSVQALVGTKDSKTDFANASLSLGSSVSMLIKFYADENPENVYMKVSINGREQIINATDCDTEDYNGRTRYIAEFTNITAIEFGDEVTAELYKDGVQVGRTLTYSVNSYIYSAQSSATGNLLELIKALYNYGKSAAASVGK